MSWRGNRGSQCNDPSLPLQLPNSQAAKNLNAASGLPNSTDNINAVRWRRKLCVAWAVRAWTASQAGLSSSSPSLWMNEAVIILSYNKSQLFHNVQWAIDLWLIRLSCQKWMSFYVISKEDFNLIFYNKNGFQRNYILTDLIIFLGIIYWESY